MKKEKISKELDEFMDQLTEISANFAHENPKQVMNMMEALCGSFVYHCVRSKMPKHYFDEMLDIFWNDYQEYNKRDFPEDS